MKNTIKKLETIRRIAIIAMAVVIGFSACAFDDSTGQTETRGNITETLKFENISRLAFMGGSLIYNPDVGASGQISKGAKVAVRLSMVDTNENVINPDEKYQEQYFKLGYITIDSVSIESISITYSEYNDSGTLKPNRSITVAKNSSGDLDKDGKNDVHYAPPAYIRNGMENAMFLTFISSQIDGNVGMYSVIPEQYTRQAYLQARQFGLLYSSPQNRKITEKPL